MSSPQRLFCTALFLIGLCSVGFGQVGFDAGTYNGPSFSWAGGTISVAVRCDGNEEFAGQTPSPWNTTSLFTADPVAQLRDSNNNLVATCAVTGSAGDWYSTAVRNGTAVFSNVPPGTYKLTGANGSQQSYVPGEGYSGVTLKFTTIEAPTATKVILTLTFSGDGAGSVAVNGTTYSSTGGAHDVSFESGTDLTLEATPGAGSVWGGYDSAGENATRSYLVRISRDTTIDANFHLPLVINEKPVIGWTSTPGAVSSGATYTVSAHANDDANMVSIVLFRDENPITPTTSYVTYDKADISLTTSDLGATSGNTTITYSAYATDKAGLVSDTISQTVTVGPLPPVGAVDAWITAGVDAATAPGSATVTWGTTNAVSAAITGPNVSSTSKSGSQGLSGLGAGTYAYVITARGSDSASVQREVTFTINAPATVTVDITATPATILEGEPASIAWNSSNASSVSVTGPNGFTSNLPASTLPLQGLSAGMYTYTISAQGTGGPATKTATVSVVARETLSAWIAVNPTTTTAPGTATVSWGSSHASAATITTSAYGGSTLSTATSGSQTCANLMGGTHSFTITATGAAGTVTNTATLSVGDSAEALGRNLALRVTPSTLPWQGGIWQFSGDCNIAGTGTLRIYLKVPATTTVTDIVSYDSDGNPVYGEVTKPTYTNVEQAIIPVTFPVGVGKSWATWTCPPAATSEPMLYYVQADGTDRYGGFAAGEPSVDGIPPPKPQTVAINPNLISAMPGQTVTLTASGGNTEYIWSGADEAHGATATFTLPTAIEPGEQYNVSVYSPAGGPAGDAWLQSNFANAQIICGGRAQDANFKVGIVATPMTLPWTGGKVDVAAAASVINPALTGTIATTFDGSGPNYAVDWRPLPYGVAPDSARITRKTTTLPANLTTQNQSYTFRAALGTVSAAGPIATVTVIVPPAPNNAPPYVAIQTVPTLVWDGWYLNTPEWDYKVFSPGLNGKVTSTLTLPNGVTYDAEVRGTNRGGVSPWGSMFWAEWTWETTGWGRLPSTTWNTLKPPPLGTYKVAVTVVSPNGTATAEKTGRIIAQGSLSAQWDAPPYGTAEDPDTGEVYHLGPSDYGWNFAPGSYMVAEMGTTATVVARPGSTPAYRFSRWRDGSGKTLTRSLTLTYPLTRYTDTVFAQLVLASDPVNAVTFTLAPLSFVYNGSQQGPAITPSIPDAPYVVSGTAKAIVPGTYSATVAAEPDTNYSGSRSFTWTLAPKPVTFGFGDLSGVYDGLPKSAAVTPSDSLATYGVEYSGSGSTTYGPTSSAPSGVGTYTVTATANGNFTGSGSAVLTIAKRKAVLTWPAPAPITYGVPLSTTQLNAMADVPGSFTYSPPIGAIPNAGSLNLTATFVPTDTARYDNATAVVPLVVNRAIPTLVWDPPSPITYGTALDEVQLNASANVPGELAYAPAPGTVLPAGSARLVATFTPSEPENYTSATAAVDLPVNPASLAVTADDASRVYGAMNPPFSATIGGFVNGDATEVISGAPEFQTTATTTSSVGTYVITPSLGSLAAANYRFTFREGTLTVLPARGITNFQPLESSYTITDASSPMNGQTYPRLWRDAGWVAYLGRPGVRFVVQAEAWPAVKTVEVYAKPPGGAWTLLASQSPATPTIAVDMMFSLTLGDIAPGQPLVPLSFLEGTPLTGGWTFRARVQDTSDAWSDPSAEVPVNVILPVTARSLSGQTVPPAGDLGAWFTASPVETYTFPMWIP